MRFGLDLRTRRLLRRVPRTSVYSAMELLLLTLLAIQSARLIWALVTPMGPLGDWRPAEALRFSAPAATTSLTAFDPFFRQTTAGPVAVTALNLKLFGVREDRASGRGSAIIALPDGRQRSFVVGEEVMPGVTLTGVGFDNVTLGRGGGSEQLFLDQSTPAPVASPAPAAAPTLVPPSTPPAPLMVQPSQPEAVAPPQPAPAATPGSSQ